MKTQTPSLRISPFRQDTTRHLARCLALLSVILLFTGCASRNYVKHFASDACLIVPQQSSPKEVLALMGQPDRRSQLDDGAEEWIYFQNNKSLLRRMPYLGDKLGSESFDLVIVHLRSDLVTSCTYRLLTEKEFKAAEIKSDNEFDAP